MGGQVGEVERLPCSPMARLSQRSSWERRPTERRMGMMYCRIENTLFSFRV